MAYTDISPLPTDAESLVTSAPSASVGRSLGALAGNLALTTPLDLRRAFSVLSQVLLEREALNGLTVNASSGNARGVVAANIEDLGAFTVAGNDGLTYAAGERVLLVNQTTAAQNGLYVVGTVDTGVAPLTRADDMADGAAILNGRVVEISEGTLYAGSSWKAMCTDAKVVGTDDPLFYPRNCKATVTLAAGTKTLGATEGLWLFSTTKSSVQVSLNTPDTVTSTVQYQCAVAGRTAGKVGTAALTVQANVAAGTINAADVSSLDVLVDNW